MGLWSLCFHCTLPAATTWQPFIAQRQASAAERRPGYGFPKRSKALPGRHIGDEIEIYTALRLWAGIRSRRDPGLIGLGWRRSARWAASVVGTLRVAFFRSGGPKGNSPGRETEVYGSIKAPKAPGRHPSAIAGCRSCGPQGEASVATCYPALTDWAITCRPAGPPANIVRRDDERAVGPLIGKVNYPQVTAAPRLSKRHPRIIGTRPVFARTPEHLANFILGDAMIINVRLAFPDTTRRANPLTGRVGHLECGGEKGVRAGG
jgi:hypothetical protein